MEGDRNHHKLHIGFITPEYAHPKVTKAAGIGTSIKNLAKALVKTGVSVTVFVYHQTEDITLNDEGVTLHLIRSKKYKFFGWYRYRKHIERYVSKTCVQTGINVLEAPDWTGITAFMSFKVPLVLRLHGTDAYFCELEGRPQKAKNFFFEKKALKVADAYASPSQFTADRTQKLFGLDQRKLCVIPNGVIVENFQNDTPETFEENTILYFGTLIRKKGLFHLAKIFNHVIEKNPNARLILMGSDASDISTGAKSTWQLLQTEFSSEARQQVHYLGKVQYEEIQQQIRKAQVCVFPSLAETFGMVTIEAMALQKAVVNTNIGWANDLIEDGVSGYLIAPDDHEEYANQIAKLLTNKGECVEVGKEALKYVEQHFDMTKIALRNIEFYKELIG